MDRPLVCERGGRTNARCYSGGGDLRHGRSVGNECSDRHAVADRSEWKTVLPAERGETKLRGRTSGVTKVL